MTDQPAEPIKEQENEAMPIRSVLSFNYCPFCGEETERETIQVGSQKTNDIMTCPNHGQLFIR